MKHRIQKQKRKTVFVAMSGGVDSSVAAALLLQNGDFDVRGVFMKTWTPPGYPCTWKEERRDAARAAAHIGIPFSTWDFSSEYERIVVRYMRDELLSGRTPNPDVICNKRIKFGLFLNEALRQGADYIATGHYARIVRKFSTAENRLPRPENSTIGNYTINIAADAGKDQSYFLWTLGQRQLRHCLFPIGEYTKTAVREKARAFGLHNAEKKDSQGLCFVGDLDFSAFLRGLLPQKTGALVTTDGREIGEHDGAHFYTIGQRRGLGVGGGIPYYVTNVDTAANTVTVSAGEKDALYADEVRFTQTHWISGRAPELPLACSARIRYRQPLQPCVITNARKAVCKEPQRAVTPGQSIVFYDGENMLGGGVIEA